MDSKTKTMIGIVAILGMVSIGATIPEASAGTFSDALANIASALNVFADGQMELVQQNNVLIKQNAVIIELLLSDRSIFIAGLTDRYIPMEWIRYGTIECFDRLTQQIVQHSCELDPNITRDQFNSLVTGNPES